MLFGSALPGPVRGPIGVVALVSGLAVATLAVGLAGGRAASTLDVWVRSAVTDVWPQPGRVALLIDSVGEPLVAAALVGLLSIACAALHRRRLAVVALAGPALTGVATTVLKPVVGRTIHGDSLAYPSGHTGVATALALVTMLLVVDLLKTGRLAGTLLVVVGASIGGSAMALAQITLDAHYPTDTIGGFCAAMAAVPASAWLVERVPAATGPAPPG